MISDTNIGGAGKYLINYCKNRDKDSFQVSVIVPKDSKLISELRTTGVDIIELDGLKDNSKDFKVLSSLKNHINTINPDIVHTHASIVARLSAKISKAKPKIVYTKHCDFEPSNLYNNPLIKSIFGTFTKTFADKIIATSEHLKQNLIKQGIDSDLIVTIVNGTDGYERLSNSDIENLKKKYGINNEKVVGYVARLVELKGHKTLFDSIKILKNKGLKDFKCLVVGDGDYKEELVDYAKEIGIEDDVIFTGFVEDVQSVLNIIDVQVNCSYLSETTNLALLEGMSLGIPTVATCIGGTPDMIQDDKNGYIVPIQNSTEMADRLYKILTDYNLYSDLKMQSISIFKEKYTSKQFAKSIEDVYRSLI